MLTRLSLRTRVATLAAAGATVVLSLSLVVEHPDVSNGSPVAAQAGALLIATVAAAAWAIAYAVVSPFQRMAAAAAADSTARQRAFIDDAAHELRTPIAILRGELELAALEPGDAASVQEGLTSAIEETDRLYRIAENLLALAHTDAGQLNADRATTDLLAAARNAAGRALRLNGTRVEIRGEPLQVRGDPEWIERIVTNLVTNADRFANSVILVTVRCIDGKGRLEVADDGPGFPPELLPRAFDRFARSSGCDPRGSGAGLGLAIVDSLARAAGGTVDARNGGALGGACITAELPLAEPADRLPASYARALRS